MNNSIKLFKIRGIDIKMHITFPLILLWGALAFGPVQEWRLGRGPLRCSCYLTGVCDRCPP